MGIKKVDFNFAAMLTKIYTDKGMQKLSTKQQNSKTLIYKKKEIKIKKEIIIGL